MPVVLTELQANEILQMAELYPPDGGKMLRYLVDAVPLDARVVAAIHYYTPGLVAQVPRAWAVWDAVSPGTLEQQTAAGVPYSHASPAGSGIIAPDPGPVLASYVDATQDNDPLAASLVAYTPTTASQVQTTLDALPRPSATSGQMPIPDPDAGQGAGGWGAAGVLILVVGVVAALIFWR